MENLGQEKSLDTLTNSEIVSNYAFLFIHKWSEVAQLCPTLWNPMDSSLPGLYVNLMIKAVQYMMFEFLYHE